MAYHNQSNHASIPSSNFSLFPSLSSFNDPHPMLAIAASSPIINNWLQLVILGGFLEYLRKLLPTLWGWLVGRVVVAADFEQGDEAYEWVMAWLSHQPKWSKARSVQVKTTRPGQIGAANLLPGEMQTESDAKRRLKYIPSYYQNLRMRYKYTLMKIERTLYKADNYSIETERLKISILSWNHTLLDELLIEAKKVYKAEVNGRISIYVPTQKYSYYSWSIAGSRAKRPWSSVILDTKVKEYVLEDARDFLKNEQWYSERGIPWRRGYLLHGAPGSGKTSLIHAIAGELDLNVYIISLSKAGLDDAGLSHMIGLMPARCLALIEEIDAVFLRSVDRDTSEKHNGADHKPDRKAEQPNTGSLVTLSGLLGAIDGIAAQEGRLLFATTNKYRMLDTALIRPGRLDVHVKFELADRKQAEQLFRCFYPATEEESQESIDEIKPLIELSDESDIDGRLTEKNPELLSPEKTSSSSYPPLSERALDYLAKAFAEKVPDYEVSMASIQGHLMCFKTDPYAAIRCTEKWIAEERERVDRKESSSSEKDKGLTVTITPPSTN